MITEATISRVRYPPELLPDAVFNDIPASAEVTTPILDLRRITGKLLRLSEIAVVRDDDVELRINNDGMGLHSAYNVAGGFFDLASTESPYANNFQMLARDRLYYNLFNSSTDEIGDFRTSFGVWVQNLTIADKLKLGIPLTNDERAIDKKFGISSTVEKGLLPLPLEQQIEREYRSQLISEETHGRTMAVTTASQLVETIYPRAGQFLVLTKLAATEGTADNNIRISISRDTDADYITNLKSYAVGLERELSCFIPAMSELSLNIIAAGEVTVYIRYTILKVKLSNLLRCRFGLMSREEAPGDVYDKCLGGIL
ncbi:unnamed protein product [marine sediment metagenome]|uniref:Uncharacterized protein n=1 Tax=marine sediment metagenome TaxID=412755 RepID=X1QG86_9ZZZZ